MLVDVIADSVLDTLELVPFLFVTYLAMEALEHSTEGRMQGLVARAGHAGPVVGALLGAIPQCGFSAMAATLFSGGVVTAGTLVAVILSTSDEMVPVFLAHQEPVGRLLAIVLLKVVVGIVVGLLLDAVLLVQTTDHAGVRALVRMPEYVDVAIPRGGERRAQQGRERFLLPCARSDNAHAEQLR